MYRDQNPGKCDFHEQGGDLAVAAIYGFILWVAFMFVKEIFF